MQKNEQQCEGAPPSEQQHLPVEPVQQIDVHNLHQWVFAIALVVFDTQDGQKLEKIVPEGLCIPKDTEKQLAMLAFPDSNSLTDYENTHKYTFVLNQDLYGYTCFKQKKDPQNSRGYTQRSLVILSKHPFVLFFEKLVEFIVFKTFQFRSEQMDRVMHQLCLQICQWPFPHAKSRCRVPVLSYEFEVEVPNYVLEPNKNQNFLNKKPDGEIKLELNRANKEYNIENILVHEKMLRSGPFQEIDLQGIFQVCPSALWSIWEAVMLNKSVLLLGQIPQQVSHAVLGSVSLISPFEYCGEISPYLTVYNSRLEELTCKPKNLILGGCNPIFEKLFKEEVTTIVRLRADFKCHKYLRPLKELLPKSVNEEQRAISESALRKYFYQLSCAVMTIFNEYLNTQTNNLKFFSQAGFLKQLKDRKDFLGLENIYSSRRHAFGFLEEFTRTPNFDRYLQHRNAVKSKQ